MKIAHDSKKLLKDRVFFTFLKLLTFFQSYPIELQTQGDHFENPLAPYETLINYEDLSETAKQIMVNNGVNSKSYCQKKLIADFRDRVEYVVHIENLQYYLKRGRVSNKMRSENILVIFFKKIAKFTLTCSRSHSFTVSKRTQIDKNPRNYLLYTNEFC